MSVEAAHRRAQRAAQRLMTDTCTITRPGARGAFNPATGEYGAPTDAVVYAGRCRVKKSDPSETVVGELERELGRYTVDVPLEVVPERGQTVTINTSADPALATDVRHLALTVVGVVAGSHANRRTLDCEVIR